MRLRALLPVIAALCAAPAALAAGGPMYTQQGGLGIAALVGPNRGAHYVAVSTSSFETALITIGKDGSVWNWPSFVGSYGIPMVTTRDPGGLSRDGSTLFLQSTNYGAGPTSFIVVNTRRMAMKDTFSLNGWYAFDALSPDGKTLYLTRHLNTTTGYSRYVVRAYDLTRDRLLPGRIADRTQRSWVMQGDAMTRTTSADGRWVYTLYANTGGYPFIHALDTVRGTAHCIGLPWKSADQNAMANVALTLHGSRLAVHWQSGRPWLNLDTRTWRVTAARRGGFPWLWLLLALPLLPALELLRRRRRNTVVSVEGGFHDSPARVRSRLPRRPRLGAYGVRRLPRPVRVAGWPGRALARRHDAVHRLEGRREHALESDPA